MGYRHDDLRSRHGQSWRDRGGFTASRHWNRDEDMGGSDWSGASGRGGMGYDERECHGYGTTNEAYGGRGAGPWGHEHHARGYEPYPYRGRGRESYDFGPVEMLDRGRDRGFDRGPEQGFDQGPEHAFDRGPFYGTGPKNYRRSDDRIREDVCELIAEQGHIDAREVEVFVESGIVRLIGTVVRRQDRRMLEHMIDHVRGIEEIQNELRLRRDDRLIERPQSQQNGNHSRM